MSSSPRYLAVLLGACAAVLLAVLALNLTLGERALGSPEVVRLASVWQQRTRGVTYSPPVTATRPFKVLRLADRLAQINAVVLGSSTAMGITESMFPAPIRIYNFSLTANATAALVGEAEYLEKHDSDRIRWMLIALDWSIGMIYHSAGVPEVDLSPSAALSPSATTPVPFHRKLTDALSLPKVENLGKALRGVMRSNDPLDNFRQTFFQIASEDYRCPDGLVARDFDVVRRGACAGFRYDGSWTFGGEEHLTPSKAAVLARAAAAPSSKFSRFLCETRGEPNPEYLQRLGTFAQRFSVKGGRALFFLPQQIPGMESEMMSVSQNRECLDRTKAVLAEWAGRYGITVIDAGRSERFGCKPGEFLDEHHAFPECHSRVFSRFWRDDAAGRIRPGLYQPE
jgi:hypothetical protein